MKLSKKNVVFLVPKSKSLTKEKFFELFLEFESEWQRFIYESMDSTEEAFLRYVDRKVDDLKKDIVILKKISFMFVI